MYAMARKPRIHYPGAVYHVMLRGNAKQAVFQSDEEYSRFEDILAQGMEQYELVLHAYCWMKNHVHMALQVTEQPLSKLMQNLSQRYTHWFNKRYDRVGHLFQGRYKAILVQKDGYMTELIRYIHLNPVRAQIVKEPGQYSLSSHNAYAGRIKAPEWLNIEMGLSQFGRTESDARASYLHFMGQTTKNEVLSQLRNGSSKDNQILGSHDFILDVLRKNYETVFVDITVERLFDIVAGVYDILPREISGAGRQRYVTEARAMAVIAGMDCCGFRLTDLARCVNREVSSLGRQVKRVRSRMKRSPSMRTKMDMIKAQITSKRQA